MRFRRGHLDGIAAGVVVGVTVGSFAAAVLVHLGAPAFAGMIAAGIGLMGGYVIGRTL